MFGNVPLHPVLPASDLERAKRWYSEKLGLEPTGAEVVDIDRRVEDRQLSCRGRHQACRSR